MKALITPLGATVSLLISAAMLPMAAGDTAQGQRAGAPVNSDSSRCSPTAPGDDDRQLPPNVVRCQGGPDMYLCDGAGWEPADLRHDQVCSPPPLPLVRAVDAVVAAPDEETVRVEWIEIDGRQPVRIVATREMTSLQRVPIADRPTRYVRFSRPGATPLTLPARDLLAARTALPPKAGGGEALLVFEPAEMAPLTYELSGPRAMSVVPTSAVLGIPGLEPGNYTLTGTYMGGVRGTPIGFDVRDGRSTVVGVPTPEVGAASIRAATTECLEASTLRIFRQMAADAPESQAVVTLDRAETCHWEIGGLKPGRYQASALGPRGQVAGTTFAVAASDVTDVILSPASVHVSGRISIGDTPAADAILSFQSSARSGAQVRTDQGGRFDVSLAEPGAYSVFLRDNQLFQQRSVVLHTGENQFDWEIAREGRLVVVVTNAVPGEDIEVQVRGREPSAFWGMRSPPDGQSRLTWDGLPFGHYTVSARQAGLVSEAAIVAVDPDRPEGMVRLTLRPRASRLTVADGTGRPLTGLAFGPIGVRVEADDVAGVYLLDHVPPGVGLLIRAGSGFVPVCRVVRSDADLEVRLENGQAVTVDIALASLQPSDAFRLTFTGIDGADCPVPFAEFNPLLLGVADGVARYYLPQFPRSGTVSAGTEERRQRVLVQDGMAVIRMR